MARVDQRATWKLLMDYFAMENSRRIARNRKLQLTDGQKLALLTAKEIADLAKILLSHVYRLVKDPVTHLTDTARELLTIKAQDQIPGWEIGLRFDARN